MNEESNSIRYCLLNSLSLSKVQRLSLKIIFLIYPVQALKIALKWIQPGTYRHCRNVERISLAVGKEYARIFHRSINSRSLKNASFFHDIGKISIPGNVLRKKRLSALDRYIINKHPEEGALIIRGLFSSEVSAAVLSHHEEKNGAGYPRGIGDNRLSLLSRIISTVDDYCAMTEARGYNIKIEPKEAVLKLEQEIGVRYDEGIIRALKAALSR